MSLPKPSEYFLIRSKLGNYVLDVAGSNPEPGTEIILYPPTGVVSQQWSINGQGLIVNRLNGFVLDGKDGHISFLNTAVVNPSNSTAIQQWIITETGVIQSKLNSLVLEILGGTPSIFLPVVFAPIKEAKSDLSQQWEFVPVNPVTESVSLDQLVPKPL